MFRFLPNATGTSGVAELEVDLEEILFSCQMQQEIKWVRGKNWVPTNAVDTFISCVPVDMISNFDGVTLIQDGLIYVSYMLQCVNPLQLVLAG